MSYTSGMLSKRVTILRPVRQQGETGEATAFAKGPTVWAAVDWSRGTRALRQGQVEAYDVLMVRMRWTRRIDRWCRLLYDGKFYAIDSLNGDARQNTVQITAMEVGPMDLVGDDDDDE